MELQTVIIINGGKALSAYKQNMLMVIPKELNLWKVYYIFRFYRQLYIVKEKKTLRKI